MSLSAFVKELRAAGISDAQIITAMVARDDERLAKGRSRVARCRHKMPAKVTLHEPAKVTLQALRNVTNVTVDADPPNPLENNENRNVTNVTSRARTHVVDNLLLKEGTGKKEKNTPRTELETVLDAEHAQALIEHRQAKRAPLKAYGAKLLAKRLSQAPDPNAAVDTMIERGWTGFDIGWLKERVNGHGPPATSTYKSPFPDFLWPTAGKTNGY